VYIFRGELNRVTVTHMWRLNRVAVTSVYVTSVYIQRRTEPSHCDENKGGELVTMNESKRAQWKFEKSPTYIWTEPSHCDEKKGRARHNKPSHVTVSVRPLFVTHCVWLRRDSLFVRCMTSHHTCHTYERVTSQFQFSPYLWLIIHDLDVTHDVWD